MSCNCDALGDELRIDHLAGEDLPEVASRLALRRTVTDILAVYQCTTCERWFRVDRWVCREIQFHEDCTRILRVSAADAQTLT